MTLMHKTIISILCVAATFHCQSQNPIIFADVPDLSIIRVGDTYYMSSTTMHMSPGVPVMKSKAFDNRCTWLSTVTLSFVYPFLYS